MGFFRLRAGAGGKAAEEDGEEEKAPLAAAGTFAADPRGLAGAERPLGASERHGGGRGGLSGDLGGGPLAAQAEDGRQRRKKSDRRDRGASDDMGGGGATGSGATASSSGGGGGGMPVASSVNDFISKTKKLRKGLKPSGPELIAYARYLGIDPVADHDLLWIAVEALEAPLPSTWSEHFDSNDRVFYYNASTRVSSWTHPLEHVYRETYTTIVNFRNSNLSPTERTDKLRKLQAECEQMEHDVHKEISLWTEHHDEHGHRFYFNAQAKQSTWTDPRPAQCHILYLKMKLVRVLSSCAGVGAAAAAASASSQGEASRFAPALSGASPRRDGGDGGGGTMPGDLGGKRAKVGGGGVEPVDQFPRRGPGSSDHANVGMGSARSGNGSEMEASNDPTSAIDKEGWADAEADDNKPHKRKKEKKKKKRDRDLTSPGDDAGVLDKTKERSNLTISQSEPALNMGKNREAAPPPEGHEARGLADNPYPMLPHNLGQFSESESLSQVGRARPKAGIRLQPLQPIAGGPSAGGGSPAASAMEVSSGMHMSSSVPELKPLEKLQPL